MIMWMCVDVNWLKVKLQNKQKFYKSNYNVHIDYFLCVDLARLGNFAWISMGPSSVPMYHLHISNCFR